MILSMDDLITVAEAATLLDRSRSTVRRLCRQGLLRARRFSCGSSTLWIVDRGSLSSLELRRKIRRRRRERNSTR